MKKLVISALIVGISTATPLSVYAKTAKHGKHKHKPAPVQEEVVAIDRQIFDNSIDLAALSPQEMRETEGAFAPLAWVAWTLEGAAINAWTNHYKSYKETGQPASVGSTAYAAGVGALGGAVGRGLSAAEGLTGIGKVVMGANGAFVTKTLNYANPTNHHDQDFHISDKSFEQSGVNEEDIHTYRAYNDLNYNTVIRQDIDPTPAPSNPSPPMPENNYDF